MSPTTNQSYINSGNQKLLLYSRDQSPAPKYGSENYDRNCYSANIYQTGAINVSSAFVELSGAGTDSRFYRQEPSSCASHYWVNFAANNCVSPQYQTLTCPTLAAGDAKSARLVEESDKTVSSTRDFADSLHYNKNEMILDNVGSVIDEAPQKIQDPTVDNANRDSKYLSPYSIRSGIKLPPLNAPEVSYNTLILLSLLTYIMWPAIFI